MVHYPHRARPGAIAPLVAICLVPLCAMLAIVIDGGLLLDERRQMQTAADAAALAAAVDMYTNYKTNAGTDPSHTAKASALYTANADGFNNDGVTNKVTVNIPPSSGPFTSATTYPGCAEVLIQYNEKRFFSALFGSGTIPVNVRAVAGGKYVPSSAGIIVQDPTDNNTLKTTATGAVVLNGGAIDVNSNSSSAATISNTGDIEATTLNIVGTNPGYGSSNSGGTFTGPNGTTITINTGVSPAPDPFAQLPVPTAGSAYPNYQTTPATPTLNGVAQPSSAQNSSVWTNNGTGINWSGQNTTDNLQLYPGYYLGIQFNGKGSATFNANSDGTPGIYYIDSHGFSVSNSTNVTGSNIMIYSVGSLSLTGTGSVTLSPPTTGTYNGMSIFEQRGSNQNLNITASGSMNITGVLYAAGTFNSNGTVNQKGGDLNITATGNYLSNTIGTQLLVWQLNVTGSGGFNVNYNGGNSTPVRQIGLIE